MDRIVFSPRIAHWYNVNGLRLLPKTNKKCVGEVPPQFLGRTLLRLYDDLEATPRYVTGDFYLPLYWTMTRIGGKIARRIGFNFKTGELIVEFRTPIGKIRKITRAGYPVEHYLKTVEDLKVMEYVLDYLDFYAPSSLFFMADRYLGDRGVVQTYFPRSPFMRLIIDFLGFEKTVIFLRRYPSQMQSLLDRLEAWDAKMFRKLLESPIPVLNFGENIDSNLVPPRYFEKYLLPHYKKRVQQVHHAGKFCHIHMDGSLKDLLPYLDAVDFDGLEALTAEPQGDVTLQEIKDNIGKKILLDGIPAIIFLKDYSYQYVREYTQKVLEMFSPRLILGVSDEISPIGQIGKIQMIAEMVKKFSP